ncbi:MAG: hypothetical protein HC915_08240 [Anaerolineae bacterium]|nr:hypothetical protein [Anaerolineae bacterium]
MKLQTLVQHAYEASLQAIEGSKLLLLHPESRYRSMVVARFLIDSPRPVFYYAMGPYDINLSAFVSGFAHDLADQNPLFGRRLNQMGIDAHSERQSELLSALLEDLASASREPYFLILDEYDACDTANDVQAFLEQVFLNLPEHCQVIINSRTMPRLPWAALVAQHHAVLLRDTEVTLHDPFRTQTQEALAHLSIQGLGIENVTKDDQLVENWEGHLPRLLLVFALERPVVTRAEICQAFWLELDSDQAVNVFHVTKRRLHKALDFDVLVHQDGYYQVNPRVVVDYDIHQFVEALLEARSVPPEAAETAWQRVVELYSGPFLQNHNEAWIETQRRAYRAGYLEAMISIARLRLQSERPELALRILLQATTEDAEVEELHREIMRIYAQLGRRSEAAAHYQALVEALRLRRIEPEPETQVLYQSLME